ncbi:MAG: lipopolysaccharide biosynthesis protein [Paludibacteraceae bacterium]|nr:lipopolysaccharide biosynthesis protein [Paludibacteraceae bacterium]
MAPNGTDVGIIARQSIKGTIATYVGAVIGLLTTFVVQTKYLTPEEIGLKTVLVDTTAVMLVGLAQLGASSSIIRFFPHFRDDRHADHGFFFWTIVVPLLGFALFGTAYVLARDWVAEVFGAKSPLFVRYWYVVLPLSFAMLYQTVFEVNCNVLMRIVVPRMVREVGLKLGSLVVYILYALGWIGIDGFAWSFCVVYGLAALINLAYLLTLKKISLRPDFSHITPQIRRTFLFYTLFATASAFGTAIAPSLSALFVSAQLGLAFTGIYTIATNMSQCIQMPYRSLGPIAQPIISQAFKDGDYAHINRTIQDVALHQFVIGSVVFMGIWFNIDAIFRILPNGQEYAQGKWVVLILCVMQLFASTMSVCIYVLNYSRYYYWSLLFTIGLTVVSVLLNNWLLPLWEMEGAAVATLLANLLYFGGMQLLIYRLLGTGVLSRNLLRLTGLFLLLCLLNALWTHLLTPLLPDTLICCLADTALRSILLIGGCVVYIYRSALSPQINALVDNTLRLLHIRKQNKS